MANYLPLSNTHRNSASDRRRRAGALCRFKRFVWWVNGEMPDGVCQVHVGLRHPHHSVFYSDAQWPALNLRPASEKKRGTTGTLCVTKQEEHPEAVLSNLLHTEAKRLWSVRRWRVLSRMRLSSSRSLEFPLSLFTSLAQPRELSLEESGKHQQGMTGISAFHSPPSSAAPPPLNSGCLRTARLLSFLLFLNTAQQ